MYNIIHIIFYAKSSQEETMQKLQKTIINERIATELKTSDFYYELPEELIAQSPTE